MRNAIRAALLSTGTLIAMTSSTLAWDYPGHRIVGAIADIVMSAQYPKAYDKVKALLATKDADGKPVERTLSQVAVFPDCAKPNSEQYCGRPSSEEEKAYTRHNSHHYSYHYTDVPLGQSTYVPFGPGTEEYDVVQMINYIVKQLNAKPPKDKPKLQGVSLSDGEAVWLLAHLVGDIHQPLHVGGIYFDKNTCASRADPNLVMGGMANVASTTGGNDIALSAVAPATPPAGQLHLFWDATAVDGAMQADGFSGAEQEFAKSLAVATPANWQTAGEPETWAQKWATEIMPMAVEAHDHAKIAITLNERKVSETGKVSCTWTATIKPEYSKWANDQARVQIRKAGFRLAALLAAIYEPQ
jgi:hypothetical protein